MLRRAGSWGAGQKGPGRSMGGRRHRGGREGSYVRICVNILAATAVTLLREGERETVTDYAVAASGARLRGPRSVETSAEVLKQSSGRSERVCAEEWIAEALVFTRYALSSHGRRLVVGRSPI
jgi:hypothetical protein